MLDYNCVVFGYWCL